MIVGPGCDQKVAGLQIALEAIEGFNDFPVLSFAHHYPLPEQASAKGVQGITQLEHGVVGGVNPGPDRAHPGRKEPELGLDRAGLAKVSGGPVEQIVIAALREHADRRSRPAKGKCYGRVNRFEGNSQTGRQIASYS